MNIDLTHPEIFTIEQLQKFVGYDGTNDRYELIQLFYKYIAPLPQRTFRTNRLGTMLTDSQRQFQGEKRVSPADAEESNSKLKLPTDELNAQIQGDRHESDRGIYTVTMQKSGNKNTAPIKLKRPAATTVPDGDQDANKRMKVETTNT